MESRAFGWLLTGSLLCGCGFPQIGDVASEPAAESASDETTVDEPAADAADTAEAAKPLSGVEYVPGESEQKLKQLSDEVRDKESRSLTEGEVRSVMGEPTDRSTPETFRKDGKVFTMYRASWGKPGGEVYTEVHFANGVAHLILYQ